MTDITPELDELARYERMWPAIPLTNRDVPELTPEREASHATAMAASDSVRRELKKRHAAFYAQSSYATG